MDVLPESIAAGSLGVVRTLLMAAGAVAPAIVGFLADTAGFRPAFWVLTGSAGAAFAIAVVLWLVGAGRR